MLIVFTKINLKMENKNLIKTDANQHLNQVVADASNSEQIVFAQSVINKVLAKEETFLNRYFPTAEVRARRQKDAELISQALGDRNEMYRILRQTEIKNFKEAANRFLSVEMVKGKAGLAELLTKAINVVTESFEAETERFYNTMERMATNVDGRQGRLAKRFQEETDKEIDMLLDKFFELKSGLLNDLTGIKDELLK